MMMVDNRDKYSGQLERHHQPTVVVFVLVMKLLRLRWKLFFSCWLRTSNVVGGLVWRQRCSTSPGMNTTTHSIKDQSRTKEPTCA